MRCKSNSNSSKVMRSRALSKYLTNRNSPKICNIGNVYSKWLILTRFWLRSTCSRWSDNAINECIIIFENKWIGELSRRRATVHYKLLRPTSLSFTTTMVLKCTMTWSKRKPTTVRRRTRRNWHRCSGFWLSSVPTTLAGSVCCRKRADWVPLLAWCSAPTWPTQQSQLD